MKPQFVVLGTDLTDYVDAAYSEFRRMDDVFVASYRNKGLTTPTSLTRRIRHDAGKLLRGRSMTEDTLWQDLGRSWSGTILFFECDWGQEREYVKQLRHWYPKSRLVMYVLNPIYSMNAYLKDRIDAVADLYDRIVTCNPADASSYGWDFFPLSYSPIPDNELPPNHVPPSDICFVGQAKTREERVWNVYENMRRAGLTCDFILVGSGDMGVGLEKASGIRHEAPGFIHRDSFMPYREYLNHVRSSRCLLEITASATSYATLRTMESVTYGKKLLTSNSSIKEESYYNQIMMRVLTESDGTSYTDFVRGEIPRSISYGTQALEVFSPRRLLEYLG